MQDMSGVSGVLKRSTCTAIVRNLLYFFLNYSIHCHTATYVMMSSLIVCWVIWLSSCDSHLLPQLKMWFGPLYHDLLHRMVTMDARSPLNFLVELVTVCFSFVGCALDLAFLWQNYAFNFWFALKSSCNCASFMLELKATFWNCNHVDCGKVIPKKKKKSRMVTYDWFYSLGALPWFYRYIKCQYYRITIFFLNMSFIRE